MLASHGTRMSACLTPLGWRLSDAPGPGEINVWGGSGTWGKLEPGETLSAY